MRIHNLSKEDALKAVITSEYGLSEEEAGRRLYEYGPNKIREIRKKSLSLRFLSQFTHFLAVLLWVAAGFSFLSEYLHPGEGMLTLGFAIIGVIIINAVFSFIQEYRAEKAVEELRKLLPFRVKALRDKKEVELPAEDIVPGDIIFIGEGDKVPADARLIESTYLTVNNASLTGESEAMPRNVESFSGPALESPNLVFAGTSAISGRGKAVAYATGMATEFGKIAHLTSAVEAGPSPLQKEIIKVTRVVAIIASTMGIMFFSLGFVIGRSFWENFLFAVGIIVANVPEGLLPTVTLSLAMGSQRMAKRKAVIKTLTSVETLGSVTVICTDKTGTLTQNKMEAKKIFANEKFFDIKDIKSDAGEIMKIAYLCNNAKYTDGQYRGDPTEAALLRAARETIGDIPSERIHEIPFDSERKRMTTLNIIDGAKTALSKGAMEGIIPLCGGVLINGKIVPIDEGRRAGIDSSAHGMMDTGLRVLAFAYKTLEEANIRMEDIERNLVFAGLIGLEDPPRPEVPDAIRKCREAGIKVIMITGDGSRTAQAIAKEIGLVKDAPLMVEGAEFVKMTDAELREALKARDIIFSRMTPKHKMRVVSILQEEGERVAVTGDGVNDAPALRKADIGIAMGITGTDVAKEAADVVLLDDNFATIVNAVEEGRAVFENIRKFVTYIFSSNIPEIVPYLAYVIFRIPLPLTIMQILAVDLGTDMFPALALAAEKPTKQMMKTPPRDPNERLLNPALLRRAYLFLGPVEAAAGLFGFFYVLDSGGWSGGMLPPDNALYMQATTACLAAIIITQIGNVFACRTMKESVSGIGLFGNKLILIGIAVEIAIGIFIIYHPWGNEIFGTSPLSPEIFLLLAPFGIGLFALDEMRKFIVRRHYST
jgi:sodium/potassium-transporting ATPase subunit alpha